MSRARSQRTIDRNKELIKARRRAATQLAELHPAEFVVLLHAVCVDMGIDPPGSRPNGRPRSDAR